MSQKCLMYFINNVLIMSCFEYLENVFKSFFFLLSSLLWNQRYDEIKKCVCFIDWNIYFNNIINKYPGVRSMIKSRGKSIKKISYNSETSHKKVKKNSKSHVQKELKKVVKKSKSHKKNSKSLTHFLSE